MKNTSTFGIVVACYFRFSDRWVIFIIVETTTNPALPSPLLRWAIFSTISFHQKWGDNLSECSSASNERSASTNPFVTCRPGECGASVHQAKVPEGTRWCEQQQLNIKYFTFVLVTLDVRNVLAVC